MLGMIMRVRINNVLTSIIIMLFDWITITENISFLFTGSGTATPTAPTTPTNQCEDQVSKTGITLPSAATVVRALSPLLTPAFAAANNMALRASKMRQDPGAATSSPAAQSRYTREFFNLI